MNNKINLTKEFVNDMIDPQGDKMRIVANWCGNGTVHRSVLTTTKTRLKDAWLETHRFLEKIESSSKDSDRPAVSP